jgi:hypothetical protein
MAPLLGRCPKRVEVALECPTKWLHPSTDPPTGHPYLAGTLPLRQSVDSVRQQMPISKVLRPAIVREWI